VSDPFGDLDETLDETDEGTTEDGDATTGEAASEPEESGEATQSAVVDAAADEPVANDEPGADDDTGDDGEQLSSPAFPFAAADQTAVYPRGETWDAFEDFLDFEVRRRLREAGVRDDTKRELHEAALQVVQNRPRAVAEQFLANRRKAGDDTE
jgi:hypothetical protein